MPTPREIAAHALQRAAGRVLAERTLREYDELIQRFHQADFRPSELSGGRFCEAGFRMCEKACLGSYTAIGRPLPRLDDLLRRLEAAPVTAADEGMRIHVPRALRVIYDLRNKRDVAHLGVAVIPNLPDSVLTVSIASWAVAEFVRVYHECDITLAQEIVDQLVARRTPMIWQERDIVRVLDPGMPYRDQVLLVLHHLSPQWVTERDLFRWIGHSNATAFRRTVLRRLHDDALIHYADSQAKILPPGTATIEARIRLRA